MASHALLPLLQTTSLSRQRNLRPGGLEHRAKSSVFWRFGKILIYTFMIHLGIKEKYEYMGIKMGILWDLLIGKLLCQISWRDQ